MTKGVVVIPTRLSFGRLTTSSLLSGVVFVSLLGQPITAAGQAGRPPASSGADRVARFQVAHRHYSTEPMQPDDWPSRVRVLSWRLLVGELAHDAAVGLPSRSFDLLSGGLADLDEVASEVERSEEVERQLTADPLLAMRLDLALARRDELETKRSLSRQEELQRLNQLRQLNEAYRDLLRQLIANQTEALAGHTEAAISAGTAAIAGFSKAETILGARRDFYLFRDEPVLGDVSSGEVELNRSLAEPYASSVLRHQHALNALWRYRLATSSVPSDMDLLRQALDEVEAARKLAGPAGVVELSAEALVCDELGRVETRTAPLAAAAHDKARPWFDRSVTALNQVRELTANDSRFTKLFPELVSLAEESADSTWSLRRSAEQVGAGDVEGAMRTLERGMTRHRAGEMALALLELRWRLGRLPVSDLDKGLQELEQSGAVLDQPARLAASSRRMRSVEFWREITALGAGLPVQERTDAQPSPILSRIRSLIDEWPVAAGAEDDRWIDDAYRALACSALSVVESRPGSDAGRRTMAELPRIIAELQQRQVDRPEGESVPLREAEALARLAEGYLTLSLIPDARDRAQLAFAAAVDIDARQPRSALRLSVSGAAVLRSLLNNTGDGNALVARRERGLRSAAQMMIPALVSMQFGTTAESAESLLNARDRILQSGEEWSPARMLDARDTDGAQAGILADSLAVTTVALVQAGSPREALERLLPELWPMSDSSRDLSAIDWPQLADRISSLTDPLVTHALALAMEEFAVREIVDDSTARRAVLTAAVTAYRTADSAWSNNIVWQRRWPFLKRLVHDGLARLVDDSWSLATASALRERLRLSDAREHLESALIRHPDSAAIRVQLIQTLVDESQVTPDQEADLLTKALIQIDQSGPVRSRDMNRMRAEILDRLGRSDEAMRAYREVADVAPAEGTDAARVRALSRVAVLSLQSAVQDRGR